MIDLLGLAGFAGSGKDTAAQVLRGEGWHQIAYADVLREVLLAINPIVGMGINGEPVHLDHVIRSWGWQGYKESVYRYEIRRLIQRTGTEAGRNIHGSDVWVNKTFERLDLSSCNYVISDVRFPNEAEAIWSEEGKVIWIDRPHTQRMNHSSETSFTKDMADAIVRNDDSHEVLRQRLVAAIERF